MAERELPSNSHASKVRDRDDSPRREPVVQGHARKRSKIAGALIAEDANDVKSYVMADVIIPAVKDIIFNTIQSTVEMLLFGETRSAYRRSGSRNNERTGYSRMFRREERDERPPARGYRGRGMSKVEAVVKSSRDAKAAKEEIFNIIDEYEQISVAEFFEICDMPWDYTDRDWGWTDLRDDDVSIYPWRGEWVIEMVPRPVAL